MGINLSIPSPSLSSNTSTPTTISVSPRNIFPDCPCKCFPSFFHSLVVHDLIVVDPEKIYNGRANGFLLSPESERMSIRERKDRFQLVVEKKSAKSTGNDRKFHFVSTYKNVMEVTLLSESDKTGIL